MKLGSLCFFLFREQHDSTFEYDIESAIVIVVEHNFSEIVFYYASVFDDALKVLISFFLIDQCK